MNTLLDSNKTVCFSGLRPIKYEYSIERLKKINSILNAEIIGLIHSGYNTMIFGAAPGFDLIAAKIVLQLKAQYKDIELVCALPYKNFSTSSHFDEYWRREYNEIIPYCKVINVGNSFRYFQDCFKLRNFYMVDNSAALICLYNNTPGGTGQTVMYARKKQLHICNIFERVENTNEE